MTLHQVLAVLFGAGNATSMYLAVRGKPWAWLVVIVSQSLNITYLAITAQWLVLYGGQPACLLIGIYGLQRWLRKGVHLDPRKKRADARQAAQEVLKREIPATHTNGHLVPPPNPHRLLANGGLVLPVPRPPSNGSGPRPIPALAVETKTQAIVPRHAKKVADGPAWQRLVVAQDAIAALNHYDPTAAQALQDRLQETR